MTFTERDCEWDLEQINDILYQRCLYVDTKIVSTIQYSRYCFYGDCCCLMFVDNYARRGALKDCRVQTEPRAALKESKWDSNVDNRVRSNRARRVEYSASFRYTIPPNRHNSVGIVSAWCHAERPQQHDRSQFQAPPMPAHRYVNENSWASMLTTKRSAGVTPEVNSREHVTQMPLSSVNKAAHSGFETQSRCHQKSKTGISVAPQKRTYVLQNLKKTHHCARYFPEWEVLSMVDWTDWSSTRQTFVASQPSNRKIRVVSPVGSIVMRVLVPAPGWQWLLWGAFRHRHPEAQRTAPGRSLCQLHSHTASSNMVNNETVKWPVNHWRCFFMFVPVSKINGEWLINGEQDSSCLCLNSDTLIESKIHHVYVWILMH